MWHLGRLVIFGVAIALGLPRATWATNPMYSARAAKHTSLADFLNDTPSEAWSEEPVPFGEPEFLTPAPPDASLWGEPPFSPLEPPRHVGRGNPLSGTSWLNRPWHVGVLFGVLSGDDLIDDHIELQQDFIGGYRVGYDFDHFWGWEINFAFGEIDIEDAQDETLSLNADTWFADAAVHVYPWGDAQWRPFLGIGGGFVSFQFEDAAGVGYDAALFQIPLTVGVKFLHDRWLALRAEITHHVTFGSDDLDTMDNVSATIGADIHFGARPRSYYPW
jgi:hypothetical protein